MLFELDDIHFAASLRAPSTAFVRRETWKTMRSIDVESCAFCFATAARAPSLESASARGRVRLRPHPLPRTCAEHRHTRRISTIIMVNGGLRPEVDGICRTSDSRSGVIVPSRIDAEAGVAVALPMASRRDSNGRATAGSRGQMAASRAQKEIVAARNRGKWMEVCMLSTVHVSLLFSDWGD